MFTIQLCCIFVACIQLCGVECQHSSLWVLQNVRCSTVCSHSHVWMDFKSWCDLYVCSNINASSLILYRAVNVFFFVRELRDTVQIKLRRQYLQRIFNISLSFVKISNHHQDSRATCICMCGSVFAYTHLVENFTNSTTTTKNRRWQTLGITL